MIIKTNETYNLILSPPELITKDTLLTTVTNLETNSETNSNSNFYIQSPKMKYKINKNEVVLIFDNECSKNNDFYQFIRKIETTICDKLSLLSKDYFSEFIESKCIQDTLLRSIVGLPSSLTDPITLTIPIDKECQFFTGPDKPIALTSIGSEYDRGTFVLNLQDISISSLQAIVHWKLIQAQLHRTKPKRVLDFGILIDDDTVGGTDTAVGVGGKPKLEIGHRIKS